MKTLRRFALLFVLCFMIISPLRDRGLLAQASCTPAFIDTAISKAAIETAVGNAADGDVICLAAGTGTFSAQAEITAGGTKAVEIRGHGSFVAPWGSAGETTIYIASGTAIGGFEIPGGANHPTVSNIRFTMDASTVSGARAIGNSAAGGIGRPWIVHHNDFFFSGPDPSCTATALVFGTGHGVFYRNKFVGPDVTIAGCSTGYTQMQVIDASYTDPVPYWESASTFGSADTSDTSGMKNFYFETNYCEAFLGSDVTAAGRMVWRFNDMHQCNVAVHGFDSNATGVRGFEFYNNTMACDVNKGGVVSLLAWFAMTGGTGFMLNNTFPAAALTFCATGGVAPPPSTFNWRRAFSAGVVGWPGAYNNGDATGTYPASHLPGWGWISGSNVSGVGSSTAQGQPGGSGFTQALEPFYAANNTNNTGHALIDTNFSIPGPFAAMAYSNQSKANSATLVIPSGSATQAPYANVGQDIFCSIVDLMGGSAPTLADSGSNTWTALTGGTNGSMRLSAWRTKVTTGGALTFTFTFPSGAAALAKAGSCVVMRGLHATVPMNTNPSVTTDNTGPNYDATLSGTLSQENEIVLGYFGLNGPSTDSIAAGGSDTIAIACGQGCTSPYNDGLVGTTGSTDASNVTLAVTYRIVTSTASIQPRITDSSTRNGLAGTASFKSLSNNNDNLHLQNSDLVKENREYYKDQSTGCQTSSTSPFNGSSGTGCGNRSQRPAAGSSTNGVAFWATNAGGDWDSIHGGANDGCLDKMIGGAWTDCWYTPKAYPHPLANVTGSGGDSTPPTPGNSGTITTSGVATTTLNLNWTKGSDNISLQSNLQYEVCRAAGGSLSAGVAACEAATIIGSFTADINTFAVTGLTCNTSYDFNVVIKDEAGNKAAYTKRNETTTACPGRRFRPRK